MNEWLDQEIVRMPKIFEAHLYELADSTVFAKVGSHKSAELGKVER